MTVKMLLAWGKDSYSEIRSLLSSKFPVGGVIILLLRIEKLKSNWENSYICSNVCAFILKSSFVFYVIKHGNVLILVYLFNLYFL